jgi:chaperonin GroES
MGFKPKGDRVLIKRQEEQEVTIGGILIPQSAQDKPYIGTVIAVGPGSKGRKTTTLPGEIVLFSKYAGSEVKINDEDFLIMKEEELLGNIE